jgi:trimeric autotransporter adhesin
MGHIHGPSAASGTAGVLIDLAPFNGGSWGSAGNVSGRVTLTRTQIDALLNGLTYVNIHTSQNPGGEVRGQIAPVLMFSSLSGVNERPNATPSPAVGSGTYALVWSNLTSVITYRGLTAAATDAHIHGPAGLFQSADVLVGLSSYASAFNTSGYIAGVIPLTPSQLGTVTDLLSYVNVHTGTFSAGEIRGQITR